jgi:hypothetical protein
MFVFSRRHCGRYFTIWSDSNVLLRHFVLAWTVIVSLDRQHAFVNMLYVMTFRSTYIYVYEYIRTTHTYISIYISIFILLRIYIYLISTYIPLSFSFSFSISISIMTLNLSPSIYYDIVRYVYYSIFSLWSTENAEFMPVVYHTWIDSHCSILVCSFVPSLIST